jgi:hypothetical protein
MQTKRQIHLKNTSTKQKRKHLLVEMKGGKCQDCGRVYPDACFDFDHKSMFKKSHNISQMLVARMPMSRIIRELEICDLVCSNCHRIRTHLQASVQAFELWQGDC